ncbi:hypothetical protein D3821_31525, partial [Escherichia coli]|uniref:hypothetical protein n=1 Tax=Escherichia coli TaxID=562 RepID=UPI000EBFCE09
ARYGGQRSRYEARLSHRFDGTYLSGSYWRQDYWMREGTDIQRWKPTYHDGKTGRLCRRFRSGTVSPLPQ